MPKFVAIEKGAWRGDIRQVVASRAFLAERYYVTFGYCRRKSVCRLSVVCHVVAEWAEI